MSRRRRGLLVMPVGRNQCQRNGDGNSGLSQIYGYQEQEITRGSRTWQRESMVCGPKAVFLPVPGRGQRGEAAMSPRRSAPRSGFTLIDLLFVIAIIAIIAAIRFPV